MANTSFLPLLFFLLLSPLPSLSATSPYLSPTTFFRNYEKMLSTFKVFIYAPQKPFDFTTPPSSSFHDALLHSPFLTTDAEEAHLFFVPFAHNISTRALARLVRELRGAFPYWNRTLGADHFFIHPTGIDFSADRNVLELKKNSVQISTFPTISGRFIPHKDLTLPPAIHHRDHALAGAPGNRTAPFLGYMKLDGKTELGMVKELKLDGEFLIESQPLDHLGNIKSSKFCLFFHGGDVSWLGEAMAWGCVPVVIVDRPIQDLPLMDVLNWSEMTFLVGSSGGATGLKELLRGVAEENYQRMSRSCAAAAQHLAWNAELKPYDAFHMVMYQLWLRRHAVRYARREEKSLETYFS